MTISLNKGGEESPSFHLGKQQGFYIHNTDSSTVVTFHSLTTIKMSNVNYRQLIQDIVANMDDDALADLIASNWLATLLSSDPALEGSGFDEDVINRIAMESIPQARMALLVSNMVSNSVELYVRTNISARNRIVAYIRNRFPGATAHVSDEQILQFYDRAVEETNAAEAGNAVAGGGESIDPRLGDMDRV